MMASSAHDRRMWELYAIRYAHHAGRTASENFIGGDMHEAGSPLDYFIWVAKHEDEVVVIDIGFSREMAAKRKREHLRCPTEGLRLLGIEAAQVPTVVITHLHYDHVGNFGLFPKAQFHLQDREVQYATGRSMRHPHLRAPYEAEDVVEVVRGVYKGRVSFHDGDSPLTDGITLHHIGGHTHGLQVVRVFTQRGWVVVASDALHLYANFDNGRPFPIVVNVAEMLEGFDRVRALADSEDHIIAGHDPLVMQRYRPPRPDLDGIVVRLDETPRG